RRGAVIAADELDLGVKDVEVEEREDIGIGARAIAAERDRLLQHVGPALDRRGMPADARRDLVGNAADPGELRTVELRAGAKERRNAHLPSESAERGAVLRRKREQMLRGAQAAGARHVLWHDRGAAWDMLAHVARQETRIDVVAAAGVEAD